MAKHITAHFCMINYLKEYWNLNTIIIHKIQTAEVLFWLKPHDQKKPIIFLHFNLCRHTQAYSHTYADRRSSQSFLFRLSRATTASVVVLEMRMKNAFQHSCKCSVRCKWIIIAYFLCWKWYGSKEPWNMQELIITRFSFIILYKF